MASEIEQAVRAYAGQRTAENLTRLDHALVQGTLIVPVSRDAIDIGDGRFDIPVVCFRRPDGAGLLPAFTSVENLFSWKSEGSKYVELTGRKLLQMVLEMVGIDEIAVNPNGVPRGAIPRSEFERLLAS
jgi:hypothetical protein